MPRGDGLAICAQVDFIQASVTKPPSGHRIGTITQKGRSESLCLLCDLRTPFLRRPSPWVAFSPALVVASWHRPVLYTSAMVGAVYARPTRWSPPIVPSYEISNRTGWTGFCLKLRDITPSRDETILSLNYKTLVSGAEI